MADYTLPEELIALQRLAKDFSERELKPYAAEWDRKAASDPAGCFPMKTLVKASELGLRSITVPEKYGGAGQGIFGHVVILEELMVGEPGFAAVLHQVWKIVKLLFHFSTPEQQQKFIPPFLEDHTFVMGIGLTEPDYGTDNILPYSDPKGGLKLSATRDGDGWVLNGTKHFIACAAFAKLSYVVARTNRTAPVNEGCTMFMVPSDQPGFSIGRVHDKMGARLLMNAELVYENCRIPDLYRVSEVNDGLPFMARTFSKHSPTTAVFSIGIARAAFEDTMEYAKNRIQCGVPIIEHDPVKMRFADMAASIEAARSLVWRAAWCADNMDPYDPKIGLMANLFSSEVAPQVCTSAMQVYGGAGYMRDNPIERHTRNALMCWHIDGLQDVSRMKVGALLAGKAPAGAL